MPPAPRRRTTRNFPPRSEPGARVGAPSDITCDPYRENSREVERRKSVGSLGRAGHERVTVARWRPWRHPMRVFTRFLGVVAVCALGAPACGGSDAAPGSTGTAGSGSDGGDTTSKVATDGYITTGPW